MRDRRFLAGFVCILSILIVISSLMANNKLELGWINVIIWTLIYLGDTSK